MTKQDAKLIRSCLDRIQGTAFDRWAMGELEGLVKRYAPHRTDLEPEDFIQSVCEAILANPAAFDDIRRLPPATIVGAFRNKLHQLAYDAFLEGELGTLVKALDAVIRDRPSLVFENGVVRLATATPAAWPSRIVRPDGRYDHGALAEAVEAVLAEARTPLGKVPVARRIDEAYASSDLSAPYEVDLPSVEYTRALCAEALVAELEPSDVEVFKDMVLERPLHETARALNVGTTTAHRRRRELQQLLQVAMNRYGLLDADVTGVIEEVISLLRKQRRLAA